MLVTEFGWDKVDAVKIWGFGPADNGDGVGGANVLVDQTKGIQYLHEIKELVISGLQDATAQGPLAQEQMRGIRFNLMDCKLHSDSVHRGMRQITPAARRVCKAATLLAEPRFLEPFFKVSITFPNDVLAGVRQAITKCRGYVHGEEESANNKSIITAFLPISETIGTEPFSKQLQNKSSGKAFAVYAFSHYEPVTSSPFEKGTRAEKIMLDIRERKGMKMESPNLMDFYDRL